MEGAGARRTRARSQHNYSESDSQKNGSGSTSVYGPGTGIINFGSHSRSGSGNLCHGDRSRTGSYPLWVGNRFSIGPEPGEASRVPARGSESLLSAAGEPQPTSHAQQQRALSLPHSPHYLSLRKLLSKHVCFHSLTTGLFLHSGWRCTPALCVLNGPAFVFSCCWWQHGHCCATGRTQ